MDFHIIDSHLHSGVQNVHWAWESIRPLLAAAGMRGAGVIPPVEDIYDRYHYHFQDNPDWQACRRRAHQYLLEIRAREREIEIFPYFFVWNDFAWEDLGTEYVAIKWHRHGDEPEYHYDAPRCREFLEVVRRRRLPILLEETFRNTVFFLEHLAPDLPVVIPHLGALSGGYANFVRAGLWEHPLIFADTAVAGLPEIEDYLSRYGSARLLFGSDYPFSQPQTELKKILGLNLPPDQTQAILGDNFRRLCGFI